ncbi:MAG: branched-chain amino acid ABC transporter substrate-binding protein [Methylobacteriaceae bacterium]|nr:branched-chain amino acid ABC transporter substrate-binding protein [Methylobacteriaceae bacterium]
MSLRTTLGHGALPLVLLCSLTAAEAADIRIAVVASLTGPNASAGDQVRRGAELAAEDINAAGGVDGSKIVLTVEDDACDPKQAVSVANRVVGEEIKLVDGHVCSGASIPASEVYAESGVLMMTPASVNSKLTDNAFTKGWTTIMRFYARDDAQGALVGSYIAANYRGKIIAFLHDKSAYGKGLADQVRAHMNAAGVHEILYEGINPGEKDYTAVVTKLRALNVEVLYYGGYPAEGGLLLRQAADQGYKFQMVTTSGFVTPEFWSIAGPAGEGTLFPFTSDPRRLAAAARVAAELRATGFEPEGFTLFSYATIQALAEGVRRAGKVDAAAVARALRTGQPVDTVFGPVAFDAKGDAEGMTYDINIWHDGRYAKLQ